MLINNRTIIGLLVICLLVLFAASSMGQTTTAEIVGTVTDASGGILRDAQVTIKNMGTGATRTMPTTGTGSYAFTLLPVGTYSLSIELSGFKTFAASNIIVASGDKARVDAKMEIGALNETVEVNAESVGALQTDSATVGGLVSDKAVQDLPVNGRNFIKLVQLVPGAHELGGENSQNVDDRRATSQVSVNGMPAENNNFMLDGMDNNQRAIATIIVKPSIDALQEVKVQTNLQSADAGRASGAVINMITKAGTNSFHGTVFEFVRNDMFDAKDYFNKKVEGVPGSGENPKFRQNQYGFSLGGPIVKNKTFFFTDYEALRVIKGVTRQVKIPTACELGREMCNGVQQIGNFSDFAGQIRDPITREPYPNNIIPAERLDPTGVNYANLYPTLHCADPNQCYWIANAMTNTTQHTADMRIDHNFGEKDNIFGRYSINQMDGTYDDFLPLADVGGQKGVHPNGSGFGGYFAGTSYSRQQSFALKWAHIFRPNFIVELGFQLARFSNNSEHPNKGKKLNDAFGPTGINSDVQGTDGLAFTWWLGGGYGNVGDQYALPMEYHDTNFLYNANFTWTRGSHNVKFGGNVLRRDWSVFMQLFKGAFFFLDNGTGSTMVNLMTGYPLQYMRNIQVTVPQYRSTEYGAYIQDDWRINNWLTLNLGLRYDIFSPFKEKHNKLSNFDITDEATRKGGVVIVAGENGVSDTLNIPYKLWNFQPRLGFAATIAKGTVLRGGFGMTNQPTNIHSPGQLKNAPFVSTLTKFNAGIFVPFVPAFRMSDPLPLPEGNSTCVSAECGATQPFTINQATITGLKDARIYQYNITLEKDFAGNVIGIGWVGLKSDYLGKVFNNINLPLPPAGPGGCGGTTVTIPGPCQPYYEDVPLNQQTQMLTSEGYTNYDAVALNFQRRLKADLTVSSNYVYGRSFANTDGQGSPCVTCGIVLNNDQYDYGPSGQDVRHRVSITANYALPFAKSSKGLTNQVFGGWEVNGIYVYSTGMPFTVTQSNNRQGTSAGQGNMTVDRPDWLPQGNFTQSLDQWFDITAFRPQALGTAGNEGRNKLNNPRSTRVDFSVFKNFSITETVMLQFRTEFFNLFNTPTFGSPGASISGYNADNTPRNDGVFGKITTMGGAYTPRDIQFALKLIF